MSILLLILLVNLIISLISLIGILFLGLKEELLKKFLLLLVGLSAGSLLGDAFLHLLPEAVDEGIIVYIYVIIGFCLFFIVERILHWHHCHNETCDFHGFTYMNLIGDGIHNFIDGLIIAGSFLVSIPIGIASSIAILFHEIPQEIGDFGVLIHGGFSRTKALMYNLFSALFAVLGGFIGYFISSSSDVISFLLPFAAGGFIYIGASDLIPELHKEKDFKKSVLSFFSFLIGIAIMLILRMIFK